MNITISYVTEEKLYRGGDELESVKFVVGIGNIVRDVEYYEKFITTYFVATDRENSMVYTDEGRRAFIFLKSWDELPTVQQIIALSLDWKRRDDEQEIL